MANDPKALFPSNAPMKPMMILPRGEISKADIARLNQNGLCVVEAKDPAKVRFVAALPAVSARGMTDPETTREERELFAEMHRIAREEARAEKAAKDAKAAAAAKAAASAAGKKAG